MNRAPPPRVGGGVPAQNTRQTMQLHSQHPQVLALKKIDQLSQKLQTEGKLLEALQCMEKSLILRGHIYGLESVEVYRACKSVGEMCNYLAMIYLQQDAYEMTLELLRKAEVLTERHRLVRAVTYNNLACYYRKRAKLRTALQYARKALTLESKMQAHIKTADTHLNMCTILSELKRHDKAIVHARIALKLLLLELFGEYDRQSHSADSTTSATSSTSTIMPPSTSSSGGGSSSGNKVLPSDRVAVLAIAYHNLAVQQEFLHEYYDSLLSYEKAVRVVTTHLGPNHPLAHSLSDSYIHAKKKMDNKMMAHETRMRKAPTLSPIDTNYHHHTNILPPSTSTFSSSASSIINNNDMSTTSTGMTSTTSFHTDMMNAPTETFNKNTSIHSEEKRQEEEVVEKAEEDTHTSNAPTETRKGGEELSTEAESEAGQQSESPVTLTPAQS